MQKVIVLTNNKMDFRFKQACNIRNFQVEYLDIGISELKNNLAKLRADVIILNKDYVGNTINLLSLLVLNKRTLIVYISKNLEYGMLYNILEEPNFIMIEESNIQALGNILKYACKIYSYVQLLERKVSHLEDDLKAEDLVRRAKLKLMREKDMNEAEAYKYIINLAMQKRIKKSELAKQIIGGLIL